MHQIAKSEIIMQTKRIDSLLDKLHSITIDTNVTRVSTYNDLEPLTDSASHRVHLAAGHLE
jgi:hypothetical protein